jgi:hypothetical protein
MTFRIELARADGSTEFVGHSTPREWKYPEDAENIAELINYQSRADNDDIVNIRVLEMDGTVIRTWSVENV